jgi:molecular chaperone DnaJ
MGHSNHYETLRIQPHASQAEIKSAYRHLVKQFHPDMNPQTGDRDRIIQINAAYEVLSDVQSRRHYDRQLGVGASKRSSYQTATQSRSPQRPHSRTTYQNRPTGREADEQIEKWMQQVYQPVNRSLCRILNSLEQQIEELAADPFDDELLDKFQAYIADCKDWLKQAQKSFRSMPNPPSMGKAAAHLYYCINQVADGLDELAYFPLNYDERYLHVGQEMFRIAHGLHCEAQRSVEAIA